MVVVSTFAFNYDVALPKLADERWGGDELVRSGAVGLERRLAHRLVADRAAGAGSRCAGTSGSTLLLGVPGLAMAWSPNLGAALLFGVPLGVGGGGFISGGNGIIQQESPSDMRGRMLALTAVAFLGSTPIGGPITGIVGDRISAPWGLAYGSLITLATAAVAVVVLARRRSACRRRRRRRCRSRWRAVSTR